MLDYIFIIFFHIFFKTILMLIPIIIILAVIGLEITIAVLQAYVFIALLVIYLNDVIALH